jgi:uncharacterized membrane protein
MSQRHAPSEEWSDQRLDVVVGNLLRTGVLTAASIVLVGGVIYLVRHGLELPDVRVFHGESSDLRSVGGIIAGVFAGHGRGLIQLGLLLLIATPVARVALLAFGFALQRDRLYVIVSLVVLAFLLYGLFGPIVTP